MTERQKTLFIIAAVCISVAVAALIAAVIFSGIEGPTVRMIVIAAASAVMAFAGIIFACMCKRSGKDEE